MVLLFFIPCVPLVFTPPCSSVPFVPHCHVITHHVARALLFSRITYARTVHTFTNAFTLPVSGSAQYVRSVLCVQTPSRSLIQKRALVRALRNVILLLPTSTLVTVLSTRCSVSHSSTPHYVYPCITPDHITQLSLPVICARCFQYVSFPLCTYFPFHLHLSRGINACPDTCT